MKRQMKFASPWGRQILFLLTTFLFAVSAPAIIRHVDNGGGAGELLLARIWEELPREAAACQTPTNPCRLTPIEQSQLQAFHRLLPSRGPFEVMADLSGEDFRVGPAWGDRILFSAHSLYTAEGRVQPASEIQSLVWRALIGQSGVTGSSAASFTLAQSLVGPTSTQAERRELTRALRGQLLNILVSSRRGANAVLIGIDDDYLDISDAVAQLPQVAFSEIAPLQAFATDTLLRIEFALYPGSSLLIAQIRLADEWSLQFKEPVDIKIYRSGRH